jgi:predicted Zn-dependent peptidase
MPRSHKSILSAGAYELERRLEDRIAEFELENGLHFIVMERHNAPIVSVHTYAKVGAFDERDGQTGEPEQIKLPVFCHPSYR